MLTQQETFDTVIAHLRAQGQQASNSVLCHYRLTTGDGRVLKCAAGVLIPDGEYRPEMESCTVSTLIERNLLPPALREHDLAFLERLQSLHDDERNWETDGGPLKEYPVRMFAMRNKLVYTPQMVQ